MKQAARACRGMPVGTAAVALLLFGLALPWPRQSHAQTAAQMTACRADAIELCHPGLADALSHRRICGCMASNYARLSARCQAAAPLAGLRRCAGAR
jgi:hypothetical protein